MPVGKNALKRVTNNGYSKVATSAPDMENSQIATAECPAEKKAASVKTSAKKNTTPKTKKAPTPKPALEKVESAKDGFVRYEFGQELPVYLL